MSTTSIPTVDLSTLVDTASSFMTTEYASLTRTGRPVTWPVTPYRGETGATVDVSTGLTYPLKAERARHDPHVALGFGKPTGSGLRSAPVIVVQGLATVRDADLARTSARYLEVASAKLPEAFRSLPDVVLGRMAFYWTRMWVEVTPLRVLWWHGGDLATLPEEWRAPEGTVAPPSDPAPAGRGPGSWQSDAATDWRSRAAGAIERLGLPVVTGVDADGWPLPVPVRSAVATRDGYEVVLPAGVTLADGPAFVTFHDHPEVLTSQENIGLAGTLRCEGPRARIVVERALADFPLPKRKLAAARALMTQRRLLQPRLAAEAERRGQPLPTFADLGLERTGRGPLRRRVTGR